MRSVIYEIFCILVARCILPHDFPNWKIVYHYFRQWRISGSIYFTNRQTMLCDRNFNQNQVYWENIISPKAFDTLIFRKVSNFIVIRSAWKKPELIFSFQLYFFKITFLQRVDRCLRRYKLPTLLLVYIFHRSCGLPWNKPDYRDSLYSYSKSLRLIN